MSIDFPKENFAAALEQIRGQSNFFAAAIKLRQRSAKVFSEDRLDPADLPTIELFRRSRVGNGESTFELLYVSICFHYEEFVRELHRAVVEELNRRYKPVDKIHKQLLQNHIAATGRLMARINDSSRASRFDMMLFAKNVSTCSVGVQDYVLNAEAFTAFFAGATIEGIEKLFWQIGLKIDWELVGKNEKLKKYFGGGGPREVQKLTKNFVERFVDERNRIVHRGGGYPPISDSVLDTAVSFFSAFAEALTFEAKRFCDNYSRITQSRNN